MSTDEQHPPLCYACETYPASRTGLELPAWKAEHGLCSRCLMKLSRARFAAAQMSDTEKRDVAHRMAAAVMQQGVVGLRPLALRVPDSHYLKRGKYDQTDANTNRTGDGDALRRGIPGRIQGERAGELQTVG